MLNDTRSALIVDYDLWSMKIKWDFDLLVDRIFEPNKNEKTEYRIICSFVPFTHSISPWGIFGQKQSFN